MKTKTAIEKEYWNQRKRIQNQIRRARKQGFEIGKRKDGALLIQLPPVPKTITEASIRRLKRMDRDWINLRMKRESKWIDFKEVKRKEVSRKWYLKEKKIYERKFKGTFFQYLSECREDFQEPLDLF